MGFRLARWMTLSCPSSRRLKFHIKYFENGGTYRYDDGVNGSPMETTNGLSLGTVTFDLG